MWLQVLVYALPMWVCVIVAFGPATLISIVMHPLSRTLDATDQTEKLRSSLSALVGTAFVFLVSLSTNQLWRETVALSGAIGDLSVQERDLYLLVKQDAPAEADRLLELLATHNDLVLNYELYDGALAGNPDLNQVIVELTQLVDNLPAGLNGVDRISSAFDDFLKSRDDYLSALNVPGIPDIVWFAVILLGVLFVALLALQRSAKSRQFTDLVMVGVVFAIGLIQLPMWTISSYDTISRMAESSLTDASSSSGGSGVVITGQVFAAIVAGGLLLLLVGLGGVWERKRLRIDGHQEDEENDAVEDEVRDVLIEIRDEMRKERAARAEPLIDHTDQGPTTSD